MCGINGFVSFKREIDTREKLQLMNNSIIHRGPDEEGVFLEEKEDFTVFLGMRRLSIIDLNGGNQPIYSEDNQVNIVFNGEIYNYKSLRKELLEKGVVFKTKSDTEVILNMYLEYGKDSFKRLDGMFAFSIYDKRENKVIICRDYFGEKPLYYTHNQNGLIWSSELKSILVKLEGCPQLCEKALNIFFSLTYIPAPFTIYENIYKLEPDSCLEYFIEENEIRISKIHFLNSKNQKAYKNSFSEAKSQVKNLVTQSVISRSVSDVPVGTFLSGGVDSSIVSLCLAKHSDKKIDTFSVGFKKKSFDETDKSRIVSKLINSNHHEFILEEKNLIKNVDEVLLNFDEPFADSSALPSFFISNCAKEELKVILTGDGGDEVFGGYNKYYMSKLNKYYTSIVPKNLHKFLNNNSTKFLNLKNDDRGVKFQLKKLLSSINYVDGFYWDIISLGFKKNELKRLFKKTNEKGYEYYQKNIESFNVKDLYDMRNFDRHVSLEGDMIVKVDRTSMLSSIECRSPFLNKSLWDFTNKLPDNYLLKNGNKKFILKEAFKDDFPKGFLEKKKSGFGIPIGDWLRNELKLELLSYINKEFLRKQDVFNVSYIQSLVMNHVNGKIDNTFKVWTFFVFQNWYVKHYSKIS